MYVRSHFLLSFRTYAFARRVLTEELPKEQRIHVHCFTDSPEVATKLLDHFPNLYIGITGVITYSSNVNTSRASFLLPPSSGFC